MITLQELELLVKDQLFFYQAFHYGQAKISTVKCIFHIPCELKIQLIVYN